MTADKHFCTKKLWDGWHKRSCGNVAKYDPDEDGVPTRCGVHSAEAVARREAKAHAKVAAEMAEWDRRKQQQNLASELHQIIRQIAGGHNDPRGMATEWLERWNATKEAKK